MSLLEDSALNNCFSHTKFSFKPGYTHQISAEPDLESHSVGAKEVGHGALSRLVLLKCADTATAARERRATNPQGALLLDGHPLPLELCERGEV